MMDALFLAAAPEGAAQWLDNMLWAAGGAATLFGLRKLLAPKQPTETILSPNNEVTVTAKVQSVPMPVFEELSKYVHLSNHKLANDIQAVSLQVTEQRVQAEENLATVRKEIQEGFESLEAKRASTHDQLGDAKVKMSAVAEQGKITARRVETIEKLVRDLPGEIIATISNAEALAANRRKG